MKNKILFFVILLTMCLSSIAKAESAYYKISFIQPYTYDDTLKIYLKADEEICKALYGENNWYSYCNPNVGTVGKRIDDFAMTPKKEGTFEWDSPSVITFTPAYNVEWQADDFFELAFPTSILPKNSVLEKNYMRFTLPPQAATVNNISFLVDPSDKHAHIINIKAQFLYPIKDKEKLIKAISYGAQNKNSTLRLGNASYTWLRDDTYLNINIPILEMSNLPNIVNFAINGIKNYQEGNYKILNDSTYAQIEIPSKDKLLTIDKASLELQYNKELEQEYILEIETSLQTTGKEIAENLKVFALPEKITPEARSPYNWELAHKLTREEEVEFILLSNANEVSTKHKFRVFAKPQSYIVADLAKGTKATSGLSLYEDKSYVLFASKYNPNISFLQSGNILNLKGERTLYIQASQLTSIKWEAERIRLPYLSILAGNYFNLNSEEYKNYERLSDIQEGEIIIDEKALGQNKASSELLAFDLTKLLENNLQDTAGIINIRFQGMQDDKEVFFAQKMVMITDIGLIVKKDADQKRQVFAYSMSEGEPLENIQLEILGANGLAIEKATTNKEGMAVLNAVNSFTKDQRPVLLAARSDKDNDISFISMTDLNRSIQNPSFETGGRRYSQSPLQGFIFSERGIFRPGDMLNFSTILRNNDNSLPKTQPLEAILYDPQQVKVFEEMFTLSEENFGMSEFSWQSNQSSLTGIYRLEISRNNTIIASHTVSMEEFQADTLKIDAEILPQKANKGWYVLEKDKAFELQVQLDNLYGTAAQDRKVESRVSLSPASLSFAKFKEYTFSDPYNLDYQYSSYDLPKLNTNKEGQAKTDIDFNDYINQDGIYRASLFIEGFEPAGGRGVSTNLEVMISPATSLIGYKPKGAITNLSFIPQNKKGQLELITVDSELKLLDNKKYEFVVYEKKYLTNLVNNNQNEYFYDDTLVEDEISRKSMNLKNSKILWDIPTKDVGSYTLKVYDGNNNNQAIASIDFNVIGNELKLNPQTVPSTLSFSLSETELEGGDSVDLSLSLPYDGFGLITLEAEKVLSHTWFKAKAGTNIEEIEIPKNYEGKAYISVSYMKNMKASDGYASPLSYSVEPILVNISKRKIALEIETDEIYSPNNKEENIEIIVKSNKASKAILFAVDEGILSLDSFQTPSPINYFLKDRALEVQTSQLTDLIMQELSKDNFAVFEMLASPFGGGMMAKMANESDSFLNPFKRKAEPPFVYWSGIIDVSTKGTKIEFPIPNYYNGNLRIMAVAVNEDAFGSVQKNVTVKNDLVINPQIPFLASPNDNLKASVMFANTTDKEVKYQLEIKPTQGLTIKNFEIQSEIMLSPNEEKFVELDILVNDVLGEAKIDFIASNNTSSFERTSTLSIRPSTPYMTDIMLGSTNETIQIEAKRKIYSFDAKRELSVSYTPIPFIQAMLDYLTTYPFDCTEQKISKALPYLALFSEPELLFANVKDKAKAEEEARNIINDALYAIRNSFKYNYYPYGLALWQSGTESNNLLTVYAGEFFLAMRKAGLTPPQDIEDSVFSSIRNIAAQRPNTLEEARTTAYAIWVLTREGSITTQYIESILNVLTKIDNQAQSMALQGWREDITALFIVASQELLHMNFDFRLLDNYNQNFKNFKSSSFLDVLALEALSMRVLALSFPENLQKENIDSTVSKILIAYNSGYSTFSSAQAILALWEMGFSTDNTINAGMIKCASDKTVEAEEIGSYAIALSAPLCESFEIKNENNKVLYYQLTNSGYSQNPPTQSLAEGLEVKKEILDEQNNIIETVSHNNQKVIKVSVGDVLNIKIIANSHSQTQENIVIQDLLAGAFEPMLDSFTASPIVMHDEKLDYKDIREDRALFFTTLDTEKSDFIYQVRAVNKGIFVLPAVYASSMYDNKLQAHDISQTIIVE